MRKYFFRSLGISKDWGKVKQKYERNYRNTEWGILGLFCGIFGCVIDSILMITLFGKKKHSYIITGDARPAFCDL